MFSRRARRAHRRLIPLTAAVTAGVVSLSLASAVPAEATPKWREQRPGTQRLKSVPGRKVPAKGLPADPAARAAQKPLETGRFPAPGSGTARFATGTAAKPNSGVRAAAPGKAPSGPVRAGKLPVWVAPTGKRLLRSSASATSAASAASTPDEVKVDLLDQKTADRVGVTGVVLKLTPQTLVPAGSPASPAPGRKPGEKPEKRASQNGLRSAPGAGPLEPVDVRLDYSSFSHAIGGDYGSRLRLVALPACSLTTPQVKDCRTRIPIAGAWNDVKNQQLVGRVKLGAGARAAMAGSGAMVLAAAPTAAGQSGDYSATSLAPSATWQVAAQSGSFSWNYPFRVPPALGGPSPQLALQYSSSMVDGRVGASNNQPSWVGEGFDLSAGFIERKYRSCVDDGHKDDDDDGKGDKNDLCWGTDNATMSFGGRAGELVKKSGNEWRLKADDGTKIEHRFNGFNDDDNDEYWIVTTTDGTRYYFGRGKRSASDGASTNAAWTVPVFGDDDGEPCHKAAFKDSFCNQAWRWNLDYVVDAHGNSMTYFYGTEGNKYGRNEADAVDDYTRGGYLERIEYGEREGKEGQTAAPAQVVFKTEERCVVSGTVTCKPGELDKKTRDHWPDVPFDRICNGKVDPDDKDKNGDGKDDKPCEDVPGPAFFTTKMLSEVTTQTYDPAAKEYKPVDTWTFDHSFPDVGEAVGSRGLWLGKIHHKGRAAGAGIEGGEQKLPDVTFWGDQRPNRVDSGSDGRTPLTKYRLARIQSESGALLSVNYSLPKCKPADVKGVKGDELAGNTRYCYPQYWSPDHQKGKEPIEDWFQKYVVESVVEDGRTGGGVPVETYYDYLGKPAWHFDDGELVKKDQRTWSQFRGFEKVRIRKGRPDSRQQITEFTYLRGMDGDRLSLTDSSKRRQVTVAPSKDGRIDGVTPVEDKDRWQGYQLEQMSYNGDQVVAGSVSIPWISGPTATDSDDKAYLVGTRLTENRTALSSGGWRRTRVDNAFDDHGMLLRSTDSGDTGKSGDESCTLNTYARNTDKWILTLVGRVETLDVACGASGIERPKHVISDVKTTYNGAGDAIKTEKMTGYTGGEPDYRTTATVGYDPYGRVVSSTNADNKTTRTSYTPADGGPVTAMTVTNPLGHAVTSTVVPAFGLVSGTVDANKRTTTIRYDALGRRTKVWLPGRATSKSPNLQYDYLIRQDGPVAVTTRTLMPNGNILASHELMDGMLRSRQSQAPGVTGGRTMSETIYDSRGLAVQNNGPFWNKEAPSTSLMDVSEGDLPAQTLTDFDGAGRKVKETFRSYGQEKWSVRTTYGGDRVSVDPPKGTTPTTSVLDAQGRTVQLWQYKGDSASGDHDTTRYAYNKGNQIASVTDPAGNVWRYEYNTLGLLGKIDDPDKGVSELSYDKLDRLTQVKDAENRRIFFSYDELDRKKEVRKDAADGPLLASWTYDKLPDGTEVKGQAVSSTRWVNGQAYTQTVTGYDAGYRPTGASVTIPKVKGEEALGGTYSVSATYKADGTLGSSTLPAAGGLPKETLTTGYSARGVAAYVMGASTYLMDARYSEFAEPYQYTLGLSSADKWVTLTYGYEDGTRRLNESRIDREGTGGGNPDSHVRYDYDDTGNPLRIADTPEGKPAAQHDVQCFQYDYLRRLTEAWAQQSGACAAKPSKEAVGGAAPYWESFTYDAVGNRTSQVMHNPAGDTTRTYSYPEPGKPQPHTLTEVAQSGPDGTRAESYGYDKTGNTTARKLAGWNSKLDWDAEGHLAKTEDTGQGVTEFVYDAGGNRLVKRERDSVTLSLGATELKLDRKTGKVTGTRYYTVNGQTIAVRDSSGKVTFLAGDHHGTNDIAIDAKTMAVTQRRFLPFGNPRGTAPGAWPTDKGFVGGTIDNSTGLVHLGAREYDPATGRFISVDPVVDHSDPQQMHGYSYSYNNPLAFTDPTGLWGWSDWGHLTLDVVGYVPVVGEVADLANGVWYAAEGNYVDASLSFASAIPVAGYVASGAKAIKTAGKAVEGADTAADAAKAADNAGDAAKTADNLTPPAAPKPNKAPENPAPAKPKEQPAAKGKADDGGSPSGSKGNKDAAKPEGGGAKNRGESGGSGGCSFVPGTPVELADGSDKPIEELKTGDKVTAEDPITGEKGARKVVATIIHVDDKSLVQLSVADGDGKSGKLTTTDNHPFWAAAVSPLHENKASWYPAGALKVGMWLKTSAGTWAQITAIKIWTARQKVHNLTVDDLHTYFVGAGRAVLVHNTGGTCAVTGGPYRGGQHKDLNAAKGRIERNHMPANQAMRSVFGISEGQGLAIQMDKRDHHLTESWGSSHAGKVHRAHQEYLLRNGRLGEAIQMDIDNIRLLFGNKYDNAIEEMRGAMPDLLDAVARAGVYTGGLR